MNSIVANIVAGTCGYCKKPLSLQVIYYKDGTYRIKRLAGDTDEKYYLLANRVNEQPARISCYCSKCVKENRLSVYNMVEV